jgi:hypothetical protein
MPVDFESTQTVEVTSPNGYREIEIVFGLKCTHAGYPPSFDPISGGDPGSEPEFDIVNIHFFDEDGNPSYFTMNPVLPVVTMGLLGNLLGSDIYEELENAAFQDATENWSAYDG